MTLYIGVDPGANGFICCLDPDNKEAEFISNKAQHPSMIWDELQNHLFLNTCKCILIEDVHSLPSMSAKSNFSFGWNCGEIHMLLGLLKIPIKVVQPKVWQKHVGVAPVPAGLKQSERTKIQKQHVATTCELIYPDIPIYGPRGGLQDGKADSLMIAHYSYLTQDITK